MHRRIIISLPRHFTKVVTLISVMCEFLALLLFIIKSNTWNNIYPVYKNTGETFAQTDEGVELLENDTWTRSKRFPL